MYLYQHDQNITNKYFDFENYMNDLFPLYFCVLKCAKKLQGLPLVV